MDMSGNMAAGGQQPLEMLDACHGRIRHQLQAIERLAEHLLRHGADEAARTMAATIMRYFSIAITNHHEDEERDLFPALLAGVTRQERRAVKALIDRLLADHQRMATLREPILAKLLRVTQGQSVSFDRSEIEAFASLFIDHIRTESEELMPLARRLLPPEVLRSLSITMSVRRGVTLEDLGRAGKIRNPD